MDHKRTSKEIVPVPILPIPPILDDLSEKEINEEIEFRTRIIQTMVDETALHVARLTDACLAYLSIPPGPDSWKRVTRKTYEEDPDYEEYWLDYDQAKEDSGVFLFSKQIKYPDCYGSEMSFKVTQVFKAIINEEALKQAIHNKI